MRDDERVQPARIGPVVLTGVAVTAVAWLLLDLLTGAGRTSPPLPWTAAAGTLALAVVVVSVGLPVRRWVNGHRERPLDPIFAARAFVLAKAACYGGAVLAGWYLAQALTLAPDLVGERRPRFLVALIALLAALAVTVAGFLVQRWCRVPPTDEDDPAGP